MSTGYLILETGDVFAGRIIGAERENIGEVVFNTSMTGYQEIMTDPSYAGQIVTFCYPLIGNYGLNDLDNESKKPQLSAMIVGEICDEPSHYLASASFEQVLEEAGVSCLTGVDTRALVKIIRNFGTVKGTVIAAKQLEPWLDPHSAVQDPEFWAGRDLPAADNLHWVEQVSPKNIEVYDNSGPHVVLMDYGCKKSIPEHLHRAGCKVTVVPFDTTSDTIDELAPDGVLFSNGPGDPMALKPYFAEIKKISSRYPSLGICLGHQLLALAHGARTVKLKYGHRGGNHPVKEHRTGKVLITPQNHSYVVQDTSVNDDVFEVTYSNVNDGSIEGLRHRKLALQTIQFHPEAHPGPGDGAHIFEQFIASMIRTGTGDMHYAIT